mgnify:CR=1 FL=1
MYHPTGIQKLSHNQILKLLRGHRVRVKHGSHHTVHLSGEQHKKLMAAHKKGAGITMQFDPFQQQMEEHHALKIHHGGVTKGKGWLTDLAKGAVKELAPHAIDYLGKKAKESVEGWGAHKKHPAKKRGRPRKSAGLPAHMISHPAHTLHPHAHHIKHGGAVDYYERMLNRQAKQSNIGNITGVSKKGTTSAVPQLRSGANWTPSASGSNLSSWSPVFASRSGARGGFSGKGIHHKKKGKGKFEDFFSSRNVLAPLFDPHSSQNLGNAIKGDVARQGSYFTPNKIEHFGTDVASAVSPAGVKYFGSAAAPSLAVSAVSGNTAAKYANPKPIRRGRGKKSHKGCGKKKDGGALYPAGYDKDTGSGIHHKKRGRKGKGVLGSLLGKTLGGVAGRSLGHSKEGEEIGSILGGVAGSLLPF